MNSPRSLQPLHLLQHWWPQRDTVEWVLGVVYQTHGPVYRKRGAIMMFGGDGQQLGLLSGGCLEADIATHARKVMSTGESITLHYDGSDEDDLAFQMGIGCGGSLDVLLQPVLASHDYLGLQQVYETLQQRHPADWKFQIPGEVSGRIQALLPPPGVLVVGGGVDARPLISLAATLGWFTVLCEPRPAQGRLEHFPLADKILTLSPLSLTQPLQQLNLDAAIIMTHTLALDAQALRVMPGSQFRYIASLGPRDRREKVLSMAGMVESELPVPLAGPAGLNLGADMPETIALSILAECQAVMQGVSANSLSGLFEPTQ